MRFFNITTTVNQLKHNTSQLTTELGAMNDVTKDLERQKQQVLDETKKKELRWEKQAAIDQESIQSLKQANETLESISK